MADAVTILREEIATLEGEIRKRRHALTILSGAATPTPSSAAKRPAAKNPAVKRPVAKRPAPRPSPPPEEPSLAARIVTQLTAHKGQLLTSAQVTEELAKTDKGVTRENVQRRLSELFHRKEVKREDGRYGVA
jgi:hypothetical protein